MRGLKEILIFGLALWFAAAGLAAAQEDVLFILDGSGSMLGQVDGEPKINIAKDVMGILVDELPEEVETGLVAYGHNVKGSCEDIELLTSVGAGTRAELKTKLKAINPKGKTPIAGALRKAADLLRSSEDSASIVLVSDGIESCGGDPCALARELREEGLKVRIHVVGFDVDDKATEQLACIAEAGGGTYYAASDAVGLSEALTEVKEEIVERKQTATEIKVTAGKVRKGEDVTGGVNMILDGKKIVRLTGQNWELVPPGEYVVVFDHFTVEGVEIKAGDERTITAAEFGLAKIRKDMNTIGGVDAINEATDKRIMRVTSDSSWQQIPPGTYSLEFDHYRVDGIEVKPGEEVVIAASDYGLATLRKAEDVDGGIDVIRDGKKVGRLTGTTRIQVEPGIYDLKFGNFTAEGIEIAPNEERTISISGP